MPPKSRGKPSGGGKVKLRDEAVNAARALSEDFGFNDVWKLYGLDCCACPLHMLSPPRSQNCRNNPFCIHRLGLEKWERLMKTAENESAKSKKSVEPRDTKKTPCGLTNAGNFCYLNSFLQIFFNDPTFRQIIYDWVPSPNYVRPPGTKMDIQEVMNALQTIFLSLEFTPYEDCNAETLAQALRLDNEQQDAQEFTLLFLDALARNLATHPNGPKLAERVRKLTSGKMRQKISCTCGRESSNEVSLAPLQLHIHGMKTLSAVLANFLSTEKLEDFKCDVCNKTGAVVRKTEILELPSILLLQLNRYSYDTDHRKKIQTPLQFPRELPLRLLLDTNANGEPSEEPAEGEDEECYELSAVMVHEGENAHYGHFYDIIKHPLTKSWWKYNDEHVSEAKIPGVDKERDNGISKPTADLKECYGLVYRRTNHRETKLRYPPDEIKQPILKGFTDAFSELVNGENRRTQEGDAERRSRRDALVSLVEYLEVPNGREKARAPVFVAFLPTQLLSDIMNEELELVKEKMERLKKDSDITVLPSSSSTEETTAPASGGRDAPRRRNCKSRYATVAERGEVSERLQPVYMSLCSHGKVSLDEVLAGTVKGVTRRGAEVLLKMYGLVIRQQNGAQGISNGGSQADGAKLKTGHDICAECIRQFRWEASFKERIEADHAWAVALSKDPKRYKNSRELQRGHRCSTKRVDYNGHEEYDYYVSKKHLSNFKRLAMKENEYQQQLRGDPPKLVFAVADLENGKAEGSSGACPTPVKRVRRKRVASSEDADRDNKKLAIVDVNVGDAPGCLVDEREKPEASFVVMKDEEEEDLSMEDQPPVLTPMTNGHSESSSSTNGGKADDEEDAASTIKDDSLFELATKTEAMEVDALEAKPEKEQKQEDGNQDKDSSEDGRDTGTPPADGEGGVCFNDELKCPHGDINWLSFRSGVTKEEWKRLTDGYFTRTFEVPAHPERCCKQCEDESKKEHEEKTQVRDQLDALKASFSNLVRVADKRKVDDGNGPYTFAICSRFIASLRSELKNCTKIPPVCQNCAMCKHGRVVLNVVTKADAENFYQSVGGQRGATLAAKGPAKLLPLKAEEWDLIMSSYPESAEWFPVPIRLQADGSVEDRCEECIAELAEAADNLRFVYEKSDIFVKVMGDEPSAPSATAASSSSRSTTTQTRRAASKSLIKVKLSSTNTVKELKTELYSRTRQSPVDQLIYLREGGPILEDTETLGEARVPAGNEDAPLVLIVQSFQPMEVSEERRRPEKGFMDTALSM